jgi:hypothetical protein
LKVKTQGSVPPVALAVRLTTPSAQDGTTALKLVMVTGGHAAPPVSAADALIFGAGAVSVAVTIPQGAGGVNETVTLQLLPGSRLLPVQPSGPSV